MVAIPISKNLFRGYPYMEHHCVSGNTANEEYRQWQFEYRK